MVKVAWEYLQESTKIGYFEGSFKKLVINQCGLLNAEWTWVQNIKSFYNFKGILIRELKHCLKPVQFISKLTKNTFVKVNI